MSEHVQWKTVMRAFPSSGTAAQIGLFRDGILRASYRQYDETYVVNVHLGGEFRVSKQIIVADYETAMRVCREIAGLPPEETPTPEWASDVLADMQEPQP